MSESTTSLCLIFFFSSPSPHDTPARSRIAASTGIRARLEARDSAATPGDILRLQRDLVSDDRGTYTRGELDRAWCAQNFHLRSFRAPFWLCKFCTWHFRHYPKSCRFCNFCIFWSFGYRLQVQVLIQVQTGSRLSITGYRLQVADSAHCRHCCRFCVTCILMYKILWV